MEKVALVATLMSMVVCGSLMETAVGAVYAVGDSSGWTTIGNVDYKQWAATKTFKVGDTIVFTYNKQFHNVMQVKHADYRTCNVSAPIAAHSTGNDTIIIKTHGHHFYVCGVPGHCQAGQKVDINVERDSSTLAPSPLAISDPPTSASMQPSPSSSTISPTLNMPNSVGKETSSTISRVKVVLAIAVFVGIA
ncbi:mavicyanin-like [Bidens hawaiensis]|uniref:mavicyanin-like n=1 Tax=Bidens hawaiensis TaxID=980011 RepID=UPI004049AE9C